MTNNIVKVEEKMKIALDYALERRMVCSITRDMMVVPRTPFITEEIMPLNEIDLPTFVGLLAYGYRAETGFEEGQVVTNGDLVGFAWDIDYEERSFKLYAAKSKKFVDYMGVHLVDDFQKVNS